MTNITDREARYLVDAYYIMQDDRKRSFMQVTSAEDAEESSETIDWLYHECSALEKEIQKRLAAYTDEHPMGVWMKSIRGIGPVLSAGLLAHIDITSAPTVGHIYQFAGIAGDGQKEWKKGEKRPYNAKLKVLCWKIGQSFMKVGGYYGDYYRQYKVKKVEQNETGGYLERSVRLVLEASPRYKQTAAYKFNEQGKLSPGHIDAMARRYAVKLFLAHMHGVWYELHYGKQAPLPWPIVFGGHAHYIPPSQAA